MRRTTGLVTAGLLVAAAALTGGTALAAPQQSGTQAGAEHSTHDRIVQYWTAERRANATPKDVVLSRGGKAQPEKGKPGGGGGGTGGVITGATWTGGGNVARTTGKVFFTMGGVNYVCSGSAVAGNANLVLTAGHCVWDDADQFATNWLFWPGYDNGTSTELGEWTATSLFTTAEWHATGNRDFANDAGLAVVTNGEGATLSRVLGTLPTMGNSTTTEGTTFSAFGYPAAKKYHGQMLTYCQGPGVTGYDGDDATVSIACDMTGGSSGGPWYDHAAGTGQITSLNSYGYSGLNRMFGPTFDGPESALRSQAADGSCVNGEVCESIPAA